MEFWIYYVVIIVVTIIALIIMYVHRRYTYWSRKHIQFVKPTFPYGNFKSSFKQQLTFADDLKNIYNETTGRYVGVFSTASPQLLVRDVGIVRKLLNRESTHFNCRGWYADPRDPMARNILMVSGADWDVLRKKFAPAFAPAKIRGMFPAIADCSLPLIEVIGKESAHGAPVEVRELLARYTATVIASVAFGIEVDSIRHPNNEFFKKGRGYFNTTIAHTMRGTLTLVSPKLAAFLRMRFVDETLGDYMISVVRKNLEHRERNNITRKDFFQLMMQVRNKNLIGQTENDWSSKPGPIAHLSVEEMAAQAFTFFVAGYDPTITVASFCLYELARNPIIQQKAYVEVSNIFRKYKGKLTIDALNEMRYVENCILETIRMHSPFGIITRQCTQNCRIPSANDMIDKGIRVLISVSGIHMDERYFKNPEEFKPTRFEQRSDNFNQFPFLGYGDGHRDCMGMRLAKIQTKIPIVHLIHKFKIELGPHHVGRELKIDPKNEYRAPINGIHLKFQSR